MKSNWWTQYLADHWSWYLKGEHVLKVCSGCCSLLWWHPSYRTAACIQTEVSHPQRWYSLWRANLIEETLQAPSVQVSHPVQWHRNSRARKADWVQLWPIRRHSHVSRPGEIWQHRQNFKIYGMVFIFSFVNYLVYAGLEKPLALTCIVLSPGLWIHHDQLLWRWGSYHGHCDSSVTGAVSGHVEA